MEVVNRNKPETKIEAARRLLRAEFEAIAKLLEPFETGTAERFQQVHDYSFGMKAKNPTMKNDRIVRKTVEYFKLKKREEHAAS